MMTILCDDFGGLTVIVLAVVASPSLKCDAFHGMSLIHRYFVVFVIGVVCRGGSLAGGRGRGIGSLV